MPTAHDTLYAGEPRSSEELTACFLREGWDPYTGMHADNSDPGPR